MDSGDHVVGSRTCEVWAIHTTRFGRIKDTFRWGHKKHVCVRTREFAQEHEGVHQCSCGFTYPKQPSDND